MKQKIFRLENDKEKLKNDKEKLKNEALEKSKSMKSELGDHKLKIQNHQDYLFGAFLKIHDFKRIESEPQSFAN